MYIIFDIGGTNTRVAASSEGTTITKTRVFPTPRVFEETIKLLTETATELLAGERPTAVAGGVAAVFDRSRSIPLNTAHLSPDWIQKPVGRTLSELFNCPVNLENDTALAGLGEAHFGTGKGKGIVVYMTISTGIGGVRIVDGAVDRSVFGFEPGHQILITGDAPLELESLASGSGIAERSGKDPAHMKNRILWDQATHFLACGIHNTILHWSPDVVVLGGSLIREKAISISALRTQVRSLMTIFPDVPTIDEAHLGDASGLYGALALISKSPSKKKPL